MVHTWVRVRAFSANYAPRSANPGSVAHFIMGKLICGCVEKSSPRYLSAQLIGWGILDITRATTFRPAFHPRPVDIVLTPELIARLPLLAGGSLPLSEVNAHFKFRSLRDPDPGPPYLEGKGRRRRNPTCIQVRMSRQQLAPVAYR